MKANLNIINQKRMNYGMPIAELARRLNCKRERLSCFLRAGKQLNKDLELITRICSELSIDVKKVIK